MPAPERISSERALGVECPWCLAPPGDWCVYIAPKAFENPRKAPAASTRLQRERAGTQSTTLHNGRFNVAREALQRQQQFEARRGPTTRSQHGTDAGP